jgi:glycosyltransferase involved in cell wall biosynthesis
MRLAIVTPRYGPEILGGAETLARNFAEQMAERNHEIHVWTSCAQDYYTWENIYPEGTTTNNNVIVYRFPITSYTPSKFNELSRLLINQWSLSYAQQQEWLMAGAHSQTFYEALSQKAGIYDALLILPYQTVLAQAAAWLAPERTILIPCLHNEPYAYLESARLLLEEVSGVLFLTPEEQTLAVNQLKVRLKQQDILGAAVSDLPNPPLKKHPSASPYLLAMGRLEAGKNLALLYDYMQRLADDGSNLRLMMVGDGPYRPPAQPPFELRGFVSEDEKLNLLAGAEALIHPSLNESFSLVLLEAWLAKCPVLVHRECPVTFGHVQRSQGGLAFTTYGEFSSAVHQLTSQAKWAEQMGENGRSYVLQNYTWPVIIDRLENILESWISQ